MKGTKANSEMHGTRKPKVGDEEEDPFDARIRRSGCADFHYKLQECMDSKKDWRACQVDVAAFKECIKVHKRTGTPSTTNQEVDIKSK